MESLKIAFDGSRGHELSARLELPDGEPAAYALFAHCFTCGKDSLAAVKVSRSLAAQRIAVLRFDFTGLGGSGGDFASSDFSSNVEDLVAAADWLRSNHGAPALLIGHSLGGAAVLAAAHRIAECKAVATIGAPCDATHVEQSFADRLGAIEGAGVAEVSLAGRRFRIRREFLEDLRSQQQKERIAGLRRALLVMHSPTDAVVGIDNASMIFTAARHPKSFVSLDGADHLLQTASDADYAATVIAAWATRYLPSAAPNAEDSPPDGRVAVETTGRGRFQQKISVGDYRFLADEPESAGGLGSGPGPYDLLSASLGACKSMTMRLYADRKGWRVDRVRVEVAHDKVHAEDCADCETRDGKIDEFRVRIEVDGNLDAEQRARLLEIAGRCPVHRTLESEIKIRTVESL